MKFKKRKVAVAKKLNVRRAPLYANHFGLTTTPFGLSPAPIFFFGGANRESALLQLIYFADQGEGVALITGEVGVGKTMLLTMMLKHCQEKLTSIVPMLINQMVLSPEDLAHTLAEQLGVIDGELDLRLQVLQKRIEAKLIALFAAGRRTLVVVDEAHVLPDSCLEWLRLLTNLETAQGKMMQLMLFGQPEIVPRLSSSGLRALADRITLNLMLRGMNKNEVASYLEHRLRQAGFRGDLLFSLPATELIAKHTGGLSRRIHLLADKAMLAAYVSHEHTISKRHVEQAIAEGLVITNKSQSQQVFYKNKTVAAYLQVGRINALITSGLQFLGSKIGLMWSVVLMFLLLLAMVLLLFNKDTSKNGHVLNSPPAALPLAVPNVATSPIVLHPRISFDWQGAYPKTKALMWRSRSVLTDVIRQTPKGVYVRLLSKIATPEQAEAWLLAIQFYAESEGLLLYKQNASGEGKAVADLPIKFVGYRFNDGKGFYWRLLAVGYPDTVAAKAVMPSWQALIKKVVRSNVLSIRPLTKLLP